MVERLFRTGYCVLFILICTACFISMPFYKNDGLSQKRVLAEYPQLILDSRPNLNYPKEFEAWLKDHIAWRDELVTLRSKALACIRTSSDKQVIIGSNGWLYYADTIPDYTGTNALTENQLYRLNTVLRELDTALKESGAQLIIAIAPNKNTVYPQYMPTLYPSHNGQSNTERLQALDTTNYVDWTAQLKEQAKVQPLLYHKTDTHWNNLGARLAAHELLSNIAYLTNSTIELPNLDVQANELSDWTGDLSLMIYPSRTPKDNQFYFDDTTPEYSVKGRMKSLDELNITTMGGKVDLNLLVLRDSFCSSLLPYISNAFKNVHYTRQMPLPLQDVSDVDIVVLEIVERRIFELLNGAPVIMAQTSDPWDEKNGSGKLNAYAVKTSEGIRLWGFADQSIDRVSSCAVSIHTGERNEYYRAYPVFEAKFANEIGIDGVNGDSVFSLLLPELAENAQIQVKFVGDGEMITIPTDVVWMK